MDMIRAEETRPTRSNREIALVEFAQTVRKATVGLSKVTEVEAKKLVSQLSDVVQLSTVEQETLYTQLVERVTRSQQVLEAKIEAATTTAVTDLMTAMKEEITRLEKRLAALSV